MQYLQPSLPKKSRMCNDSISLKEWAFDYNKVIMGTIILTER